MLWKSKARKEANTTKIKTHGFFHFFPMAKEISVTQHVMVKTRYKMSQMC